MKTIVTQSLKWYLRGCLPRDEIYQILDGLWKPKRLLKLQFRNRRVLEFVDWLHRDRVSLNRIRKITIDYQYPTLYVLQVWYYTRRGNERYCGYAMSRR